MLNAILCYFSWISLNIFTGTWKSQQLAQTVIVYIEFCKFCGEKENYDFECIFAEQTISWQCRTTRKVQTTTLLNFSKVKFHLQLNNDFNENHRVTTDVLKIVRLSNGFEACLIWIFKMMINNNHWQFSLTFFIVVGQIIITWQCLQQSFWRFYKLIRNLLVVAAIKPPKNIDKKSSAYFSLNLFDRKLKLQNNKSNNGNQNNICSWKKHSYFIYIYFSSCFLRVFFLLGFYFNISSTSVLVGILKNCHKNMSNN